jgi:uncharacterized membrane protein
MTALFVLHGFIVIQQAPLNDRRWSAIDLVTFILNSALYGAIGYLMIQKTYAGHTPALLTAGLALAHAALARHAFTRWPKGAPIQTAAIALTGVFAVLTLPILFDKASLTIGWALLAFAMLYCAVRLRSPALRYVALLLYVIVLVRLLVFDLVDGMVYANLAEATPRDYFAALFTRLWTFGITIGSLAGAYRLERRRAETGDDAGLPPMLYWITSLLLFFYLQFELHAAFQFLPNLRVGVLTALWCAMGLHTYRLYQRDGHPLALVVSCLFLGGALFKALLIDLFFWQLNPHAVYGSVYGAAAVLARALNFGLLIATMTMLWKSSRTAKTGQPLSGWFGSLALGVLFIYATLEWNTFLFRFLPDYQTGGLSVLWAVFALAFVTYGIRTNRRGLRMTGLLLFGIVVAKVFLFDLVHTPIHVRILAFFLLGLALIAGSFIYIRGMNRK